jgi:hypothetical protein
MSFVILTIGFGGLAAFMTGRALALIWRTRWHIFGAALLLAAAVRFLHYAMLQEELVSVTAFTVDFIVLFGIGWFGFGWTRRHQMRKQYGWLAAL